MTGASDEQPIAFAPSRVYLYESSGFDVDAAAKAMVKCLAGWAARYEFWPVGHPGSALQGSVPTDAEMRHALVEESWRWLHDWWARQHPDEGLVLIGAYLERGAGLVLDQHDGFSDATRVFLSEAEFAQLRDCLTRRGVPADFLQQQDSIPPAQPASA